MPAIGLITEYVPPEKRQRYVEDGIELKFSEGAVQLAFALYLLSQPGAAQQVEVFPDGEHGKRFPIKEFLEQNGFRMFSAMGSTSYGGVYGRGDQRLTVNPKSHHGRGDVVGAIGDRVVRAECKGGIVNSRHSGARSRLRSGLCELVGQTIAMEDNGDRNIAVAPKTPDSVRQAERIARRCAKAGIEIALVSGDGSIDFISASGAL